MAKITVGCKLPTGLFMDVDGVRVELNGKNSSLVIGGYGLTENVDKDLFDRWMDQHKDSAVVLEGFIFAQNKTNDAKAQAADNADNTNGFEGINPAAPGPGIAPVEA